MTNKIIFPGDIWLENDGDPFFVVNPEFVDNDDDRPQVQGMAYYLYGSAYDRPIEDSVNYGVTRRYVSLAELVYRQEDVWDKFGPNESHDEYDDEDWWFDQENEDDEEPIVWVAPVSKFETKDSGARYVSDSGYQRDTEEGKPRFDLMYPKNVPFEEQFITRFASLLARGAQKYNDRNWEKADSQVDLERYKSSAHRHLIQWLSGEVDEDHAAAVVFNLLAHETLVFKMSAQDKDQMS